MATRNVLNKKQLKVLRDIYKQHPNESEFTNILIAAIKESTGKQLFYDAETKHFYTTTKSSKGVIRTVINKNNKPQRVRIVHVKKFNESTGKQLFYDAETKHFYTTTKSSKGVIRTVINKNNKPQRVRIVRLKKFNKTHTRSSTGTYTKIPKAPREPKEPNETKERNKETAKALIYNVHVYGIQKVNKDKYRLVDFEFNIDRQVSPDNINEFLEQQKVFNIRREYPNGDIMKVDRVTIAGEKKEGSFISDWKSELLRQIGKASVYEEKSHHGQSKLGKVKAAKKSSQLYKSLEDEIYPEGVPE